MGANPSNNYDCPVRSRRQASTETPEGDRRGGGRPREEESNQHRHKRRLGGGQGKGEGAGAWISCRRGKSLSIRAPGRDAGPRRDEP